MWLLARKMTTMTALSRSVSTGALWRISRPSVDGSHHVISTDEEVERPLYAPVFHSVLPFHPPGYAPVKDSSGAFHINELGDPIYQTRFKRTFGFYEGFAAVIDRDGYSYHITPSGDSAYNPTKIAFPTKYKKFAFAWCGNFQQGRCVVRAESTDGNNYYHIKPDGSFIKGGPYEYAGDYREESAVVRDKGTGLCHHVDLNGNRLYSHKGFVDLDVFHKGFARAKDVGGWFHIDTKAHDISNGTRYSYLEPFYNGMALAQLTSGQRVVIDEDNVIATTVKSPTGELQEHLHSLCVRFWPSFALKLGLEKGFADEDLSVLRNKIPANSFSALQAAWIDLGLLSATGGKIELSQMGRNLKLGLPDRDRADYWLGIQMKPWLEASQRFSTPPSHQADSFFDSLEGDDIDLCQRTLLTYAQDDWADVVDTINFAGVKKVVDIGGGFGFLAKVIRKKHTTIECTVVEKSEVVSAHRRYVSEGKLGIVDATGSGSGGEVQFVVGDLFSGDYPEADMYILSRVLHDWSNKDASHIMTHLKKSIPALAQVVIIDRHKVHEGTHGLLQLNMLILNGGTERTAMEFDQLFTNSGWKQKALPICVSANCTIMTLQQ